MLPPVRVGRRGHGGAPPVREDEPADRVPPGYFREDDPAPGRTGARTVRGRCLRSTPTGAAPSGRSDWAEETPLDDLPTLADELLGPHDEAQDGGGSRGGGAEGAAPPAKRPWSPDPRLLRTGSDGGGGRRAGGVGPAAGVVSGRPAQWKSQRGA